MLASSTEMLSVGVIMTQDLTADICVYSLKTTLSLEALVNKIALPLIKCNKEFITFVIVMCCRNCS